MPSAIIIGNIIGGSQSAGYTADAIDGIITEDDGFYFMTEESQFYFKQE